MSAVVNSQRERDEQALRHQAGSVFYKLGKFVAENAWVMVIAGCVVNLCLALGLNHATSEVDIAKLWIKQDGRVIKEIDYREANTNDFVGTNTPELVLTIANPSGDVLTAEVLQDHLDALIRANEFRYTYRGDEYSLDDFCFASGPAYETPCHRFTVLDCFSEGAFDSKEHAENYISRPSLHDGTIKETIDAGCKFFDDGAMLPSVENRLTLGSPTPLDWGPQSPGLLRAEALETVYVLIDDNRVQRRVGASRGITLSLGEAEDLLYDFKLGLVNAVVADTPNSKTQSLTSATGPELLREHAKASMPLIVLSYVLMFSFAALSMIPFSQKNLRYMSKPLVGVGGVLCVALAVAGGLGVASALGISFNPTSTQALPFLLLGLAMDDMFVMAETFPSLDTVTNPKILTARTMAVVGPSITLTSFTNCAVFVMGGALTPLPVVSDFAYMAAIAIALAYFTGLLVFPAVMCLDQKRLQDQRSAFCPCNTTPEVDQNMAAVGVSELGGGGFGVGSSRRSLVHDFKHDATPLVIRMANMLSSWRGLLMVLVVYVVLVAIAIAGEERLEDGLSFVDVAPKGTQGAKAAQIRVDHFGFYNVKLAAAAADYSRPEVQMELQETYYKVTQTSKVLDGTPTWLLAILGWMAPDCSADTCGSSQNCTTGPEWQHTSAGFSFAEGSPYCDTEAGTCTVVPQPEFERCFQAWHTHDSRAKLSGLDVLKDMENGGSIVFPIRYLAMPMKAFGLTETADFVTLIREVRAVTDSTQHVVMFPVGGAFTYFEQYLTLREDMWTTVSYSLLICFACASIMLALVPDSDASRKHALICAVWGGLVITAVVALHVFLVYGFLGLADIKLSAIPVISLIMTVGVGVEFTAHIVLAFINGTGDRAMRVQEALAHMLVPTVNGSVSTLLGVIMLAFSEFPFILKYFFLLYLFVILFGVLNGLLLLPTLLAYAGPPSIHAEETTRLGGGVPVVAVIT